MYRWLVEYVTPTGVEYRRYFGEEPQIRKIAESMSKLHGWRWARMTREW